MITCDGSLPSCSRCDGPGDQPRAAGLPVRRECRMLASGSARVASLLTNRELDVLVLLDQR